MCPTTTCESQCMTVDSTPTVLAKSRPKRTALYSASLLVVKNWRRNTHSIVSLSSDHSKNPAPPAYWLDEPFVHIYHAIGFFSSSFLVMNSAIKSAKACALIAVLGHIGHRTPRAQSPIEPVVLLLPSCSSFFTAACPFGIL